jgi:protein-L-isoaspartate(D-aspartate) O-methyltransferase
MFARRVTPADRAPERNQMIERQLVTRGIVDRRVLDAFRNVPREAFVGEDLSEFAYDDAPLPIGGGQTISQPYVVAFMLEQLELKTTDRVLEVGAGSGYAAALLSRLAGSVHALERRAPLARTARVRLQRLAAGNVEVHHADGSQGWPAAAPFDAILVSAGAFEVPRALTDQLAPGGRLVIPIGGTRTQVLLKIVRADDGALREEDLGAVSFVPLVTGIADTQFLRRARRCAPGACRWSASAQ